MPDADSGALLTHQKDKMHIINDQNIPELRRLIDGAQNIIVVCHHNPDGDALGSSLALARYLESSGKEATVIIPDAYPDFLMWLPGTHNIIRFDKHPDKAAMMLKICDLIFCLDFNNLSPLGDEMQKAVEASKAPRILIDHHRAPDIKADVTISVPEACSTSILVFQTIEQLRGCDKIDRAAATFLYCGMMTDTVAFTYNSNDPAVYEVIAKLISKGINKDKIYRNVNWVFSVSRMRLWGHILQNFIITDDGKATYFTISKEDIRRFNFIKGDAEGLVNMPLQIKGVKLSISLREDTEKENLVWVSLRSVDDFPCNEMAARFFNGGGHLNASGGRLYCSLKEAEEITRKAIDAML